MVAVGRAIQAGYFDHPPAAWWLSWAGAKLFGSEAPVVVRLPFIALFALSSWLVYRIGTVLYHPRAGLWGAVILNLSPVYTLAAGSWVLPDGPLDCALLGGVLCLIRAADSPDSRRAWGWWIGAGLCAGLALFSKYSAVLTLGGAGLYVLTAPKRRLWLGRPGPYVATVIALLIFSPVVIWNATHGWASFGFQSGRSGGAEFHPGRPFSVLGGEALFTLPWIWLPLMVLFLRGLKRGPADDRGWFLCCLGAIPIVLFPLVALWSHQRVLFHWAAPGYLMLFPLLGQVASQWAVPGYRVRGYLTRGHLRRTMIGTTATIGAALLVVGLQVRLDWPAGLVANAPLGKSPVMQAVDWTALKPALVARGLLTDGVTVIGATRWLHAGKIDYALGGSVPVICLGPDPRQYGLTRPASHYNGQDVLMIEPALGSDDLAREFGAWFERIEPLPPVTILHGGRPGMEFRLALGHKLRSP